MTDIEANKLHRTGPNSLLIEIINEARREGIVSAHPDIVIERMIAMGIDEMPPPEWAIQICTRTIEARANIQAGSSIVRRVFGTGQTYAEWIALRDAAITESAVKILNNIRPHKTASKTVDWPRALLLASIAGETQSELARRLGVTRSSVAKSERRYRIQLRRVHMGKRGIDWPTHLERAGREGLTQSELARELGVSQGAVAQQQVLHSISLPRSKNAARGIDWDDVFARASDGTTFAEIARQMNVSPTVVSGAAQTRGISTPIRRRP